MSNLKKTVSVIVALLIIIAYLEHLHQAAPLELIIELLLFLQCHKATICAATICAATG